MPVYFRGWGIYGVWKDGLFVYCERLTKFDRNEPKFRKAIKGFGPSSAAQAMVVIEDFESDWRRGMDNDQLHSRYNYKKPKYKHRPGFRLFQIRVGQKRKSELYRAVVMFYDEELSAIWVHAFKKEGDSEPQEIEFALARADECWNRINKTGRARS